MSMGDLSIFCSVRFLSSVVCSFPCRGHFTSFKFILMYLIFFEAIVNGIVFLSSFSVCSLLVYKKATGFCELILYSAALLKLFMVSSFLVEFFGSFSIRSSHL
jgi:hypothetical protein